MSTMSIKVLNVKNGDVLPHSLALLDGRTTCDKGCKNVSISNSSMPNSPITKWPLSSVDGRFKAVIYLKQGENVIQLKIEEHHENYGCEICLNYIPPTFDRVVKLLYVVCADDPEEGCFQGPSDQPPHVFNAENAMRRIQFNAQLLQVFTAECLVRHGLSRKTFCLEMDPETGAGPVCHRFILKSLSVEQARDKNDRELWDVVRNELAEDQRFPDKELTKFVAFLSFTRYHNSTKSEPKTHNEIMAFARGHAALGGGGLALLGTACLHTWAEDVSEITKRFMDSTKVDRFCLLDDSSYRNTYWSCYATSLGAVCHEMGHTFDLRHSISGIMNRGFTNINQVFVLGKLCSDDEMLLENKESCEKGLLSCSFSLDNVMSGSSDLSYQDVLKDFFPAQTFTVDFQGNDSNFRKSDDYAQDTSVHMQRCRMEDWGEAYWDRASAVWLSYHRWFNPPHPKNSGHGPRMHGLEIRSRHGLRIVIVESDHQMVQHWEFLKASGRITFQLVLDSLRPILANNNKLTIKAMDNYGNVLETSIPTAVLLEQL